MCSEPGGCGCVIVASNTAHGGRDNQELGGHRLRGVKRSPAFWLDLAVKISLVLLLAFGAFSGLERFAGKAFGWRLVGYSIAAVIVPVVWAARGRRPPYPFAVDTLFVLPFLIDTAGNALNLYDTIDWWDDANHFVNWALLSGALAMALRRTNIEGSSSSVLWSGSAR